MKLGILALLFTVFSCFAQNQTRQSSTGNCSPNIIHSGTGPLTLQLSGSCNNEEVRLLTGLNANLERFFRQFPGIESSSATIANLNELLEKKNKELASKAEEVEEWTRKYTELAEALETEANKDNQVDARITEAVKQGDLSQAEALLQKSISNEEMQIDRLALNHYILARVYDLRSQTLKALPEYAAAYRYRPEQFMYALGYMNILYSQRRYTEAEQVTISALAIARKSGDIRQVAGMLNNLGMLYSDTARIPEAESAYTESLEIFKRLATDNPDSSAMAEAGAALMNLGEVYAITDRLGLAESAFQEGLGLYQHLAESNSAYVPFTAAAWNSLGVLYRTTQRYGEAEAALLRALEIRRQLPDASRAAIRRDVAQSLFNLGNLYEDLLRLTPEGGAQTRRLAQAESAYTEALALRKELADGNREAYILDLAMSLHSVGRTRHKARRFVEADSVLNEALSIWRQLARDNSVAHLSGLGLTLNTLGAFYSDTSRWAEAELVTGEALTVWQQLTRTNPTRYAPYVAGTLSQLASVYYKTQRYEQAKPTLLAALANFRTLERAHPGRYLPSVALDLNNLGLLEYESRQFHEAEAAYTESLTIRRQLAQGNPSYLPLVAQSLRNLATLYRDFQRPSEAEMLMLEALEILDQRGKQQ